MILLLFKSGYKQISLKLQKKIDNINDTIFGIVKSKKEAEEKIININLSLEDAKEMAEKIVLNAECEAEKIFEQSERKLSIFLKQKEKEHQENMKKIHQKLLIDLQNRIISYAAQGVKTKFQDAKEDREIQNIDIENTAKMLEELAKKYENRLL